MTIEQTQNIHIVRITTNKSQNKSAGAFQVSSDYTTAPYIKDHTKITHVFTTSIINNIKTVYNNLQPHTFNRYKKNFTFKRTDSSRTITLRQLHIKRTV